ncbi:cysteinyl-tRNA synthetase [Aurantimicrobium minutum]|uniref:cysteine--tRNA ligase n=4 Tax=Aurantimicrobium TaxID=1705353 RepID=UPI002405B3BE|nr:cysteine--tRNA ligase [Aurantimicrobium minutum]MDF9809651.1 cysteinyl-tRNA synthetase [Aurantimicrobium minutum]MDH6207213.1 cysteinyl-tRNA synthetase [Aurantimicrobium minutum]
MSIRLFDSKEQALRDFSPLTPGRVGMYVCGPTVQSSPHVGHLRSALVYDQLRRWLTHEGYQVTLVRNVTDIDDKVLDNAKAGGVEEWWALAYRMEAEFTAAYDLLGIQRPTYEPRATASIPEMIAIIERLIERGHAYPAADNSGDVYFDTASWSNYGELTNQKPAEMEAAADADPRGKKAPQDFALWKGHKAGDPESASWKSPWGVGRPGWHIECSAMSTKYLGTSFDIHGGGLDLRFPHHENELAQSAAAGDGFAQYWLHNGLVSVGGQKMSKSLGNSVFAADLLDKAKPVVLRYLLGSAQYRSTLELHDGAIAEAKASFERIEGFLDRVIRDAGELASADVPAAFRSAMNDDLNIPAALAVVFELVRSGNSALDSGDVATAASQAAEVVAMLDVLGVNPLDAAWATDSSQGDAALDLLMAELLEARAAARANKDFATADLLRERLAAAGITIEDTPNGAHWSFNGR